MQVIVKFEDNDYEYSVDFFKLAGALNVTEGQIKQAVQNIVSKT